MAVQEMIAIERLHGKPHKNGEANSGVVYFLHHRIYLTHHTESQVICVDIKKEEGEMNIDLECVDAEPVSEHDEDNAVLESPHPPLSFRIRPSKENMKRFGSIFFNNRYIPKIAYFAKLLSESVAGREDDYDESIDAEVSHLTKSNSVQEVMKNQWVTGVVAQSPQIVSDGSGKSYQLFAKMQNPLALPTHAGTFRILLYIVQALDPDRKQKFIVRRLDGKDEATEFLPFAMRSRKYTAGEGDGKVRRKRNRSKEEVEFIPAGERKRRRMVNDENIELKRSTRSAATKYSQSMTDGDEDIDEEDFEKENVEKKKSPEKVKPRPVLRTTSSNDASNLWMDKSFPSMTRQDSGYNRMEGKSMIDYDSDFSASLFHPDMLAPVSVPALDSLLEENYEAIPPSDDRISMDIVSRGQNMIKDDPSFNHWLESCGKAC